MMTSNQIGPKLDEDAVGAFCVVHGRGDVMCHHAETISARPKQPQVKLLFAYVQFEDSDAAIPEKLDL